MECKVRFSTDTMLGLGVFHITFRSVFYFIHSVRYSWRCVSLLMFIQQWLSPVVISYCCLTGMDFYSSCGKEVNRFSKLLQFSPSLSPPLSVCRGQRNLKFPHGLDIAMCRPRLCLCRLGPGNFLQCGCWQEGQGVNRSLWQAAFF